MTASPYLPERTVSTWETSAQIPYPSVSRLEKKNVSMPFRWTKTTEYGSGQTIVSGIMT